MRKLMMALLIPGVIGFSPLARAQDYKRHNLTLSAGAALPRGELRPLFSTSPLVGFGYGYRFHRNLQIDAGLESAFGAADVRDWLPTQFGDLRIRDYQYFVPFGGRVILPLADERLQIFGGFGGGYMRYTERIRQPFQQGGFRIDCSVCAGRHGFGYYSTFGFSAALDEGRHFRLGGGTKVYRGSTSGDAYGAAPPRETTDRWINIYASFGFSF